MKIKHFVLALIVGFLLTINVNAANIVKENDSTYQGATYIIGSTRFDSSFILSIDSIKTAVQNDFLLQYSKGLMPQEIEIKTYYKSGFDGAWYEINDEVEGGLRALNASETASLKANLNIYFINNVVKKFVYEYSESINIDTLSKSVSFEKGKFIVPANVFQFKFKTQDGADVIVTTENLEQDIDEEGEGTLNIDVKPLIDIILPKFVTEDGFFTGMTNSIKVKVRIKANSYKHDSKLYYLSLYADEDDGYMGSLEFINSESNGQVLLDKDINEFEIEIYTNYAQTLKFVSNLYLEDLDKLDIYCSKDIKFEDLPYAEIEYLGGLKPTDGYEGDLYTLEKNSFMVHGAEISWYPADASVGRTLSGNRFGLKITAPDDYKNSLDENVKITRTMYYNDGNDPDIKEMTWEDAKDGDGTYFEFWPLVNDNLDNITITIKWNDVNTQTINVDMNYYTLEETPTSEVSYIAGITQEPNIYKDNDNTKVDMYSGKVSWYPADSSVGRVDAGNRVGFKITAPEEYINSLDENVKITRTMYYNDGSEPDIKEMTWEDAKDGDGTYFEFWPLITSSLYRIELEIAWDSNNIETIVFNIDQLEFEVPQAEVSYIDGITEEPVIFKHDIGTTIDINSGKVSWYPADSSVGRTLSGNRFGFKITAPKGFILEDLNDNNIKISYYYNDKDSVVREMTWEDAKDGDGTYFEFWPLITNSLYRIELEIAWDTNYTEIIEFNIYNVELETPQAEVSYIGGLSNDPIIDVIEATTNIEILDSTISWYHSDASVGRMDAGNRFGFKITAPEGYTVDDLNDIEIIRTSYYGDKEPVIKEMTWKDVKDGDGTYYETWPLIDSSLHLITIEIKWSESTVQIININLSNFQLESAPKAEVSYIDGTNAAISINEYNNLTTVELDGGYINWYDADPFVGRLEAGNRVGFKITAPDEYKNSLDENVKIIRTIYHNDGNDPDIKEMTWEDAKDGDGTYFEFWPLFTNSVTNIELSIEWEKGNVHKIVIQKYDNVVLENKPIQADISYIGGLSVAPKIYGNTILINEGVVNWYDSDISVGRMDAGNRFGFKLTAPNNYSYDDYKDVEITRTSYYSDKEPVVKEMTWKDVKDGDGTYYETWPLITDTLDKIVIEIAWPEKTQVITIHIADAVSLQANE